MVPQPLASRAMTVLVSRLSLWTLAWENLGMVPRRLRVLISLPESRVMGRVRLQSMKKV